MPNYSPQEIEPAGEGNCSKCGKHAHLWSDEYDSGYIEPICIKCLINERPSDYPQALIEDTVDYEIIDGAVVLDFGYGLTADFEFDEERVPSSRNPNETDTVIQPSMNRGATVRYKGEEVGTFKSKSWHKYAEEKAQEYYINHRGRR